MNVCQSILMDLFGNDTSVFVLCHGLGFYRIDWNVLIYWGL